MNNFIDLTDKQIEQKINETHARLSMAYGLGNPSVIMALNNHKVMLHSILESRKEEKLVAELNARKEIVIDENGVTVTGKPTQKQKPKKTPISTDVKTDSEPTQKNKIIWSTKPPTIGE